MTSYFWDTGNFETSAPKDPQMTLHPTRPNVSNICNTSIPWLKFHSVLMYGQLFSRSRPFWDKCTRWLPNDFENYKVKGTLYMCYWSPKVINFTPFPSTTNRFWDTKLSIIRNVPNDLRMTLKFNSQRYPVVIRTHSLHVLGCSPLLANNMV